MKFQEYVPGADVRGWVLDGELVGMVRYDYDADGFSFEQAGVDSADVRSVALSPDPELRDAVVRAGELSQSVYTTVDLRVADDREFVVLEGNVPGRFAYHDDAGTTDVGGAIAEYLVG